MKMENLLIFTEQLLHARHGIFSLQTCDSPLLGGSAMKSIIQMWFEEILLLVNAT